MAEANIKARRPLFDRLVDYEPQLEREVRPLRALDGRGLKESVRRELQTLFNTRCEFSAQRLPVRDRSVINYGIPDFSHFSAHNMEDRRKLATILRHAIEAFEPRLRNVRVELVEAPGDPSSLGGVIEAMLAVGNLAEPIAFRTVLQLKEGLASIDELSE
jgi:type VI secretion system lysozyme-like protein